MLNNSLLFEGLWFFSYVCRSLWSFIKICANNKKWFWLFFHCHLFGQIVCVLYIRIVFRSSDRPDFSVLYSLGWYKGSWFYIRYHKWNIKNWKYSIEQKTKQNKKKTDIRKHLISIYLWSVMLQLTVLFQIIFVSSDAEDFFFFLMIICSFLMNFEENINW